MKEFLSVDERLEFENDIKLTINSITEDIKNSALNELSDDDLLHVRDLIYKLWRNI